MRLAGGGDFGPIEFNDAIGVQDHQQVSRQLTHLGDDLPDFISKYGRHRFEPVVGRFDHVAYVVHEQTDQPAGDSGDHIDALTLVVERLHIQKTPHVDGGHDVSTKIDQSTDNTRGQRHLCHFVLANDFLDVENGNAEEVLTEVKSAKLHKCLRRHAGQFLDVQQIRDPLLDDGASQNAALPFADLDLNTFFDDVFDRVDYDPEIICF